MMPLRKEQYRDMNKYYKTRREQVRRWAQRTGSGQYPRRAWTEDENRLVLDHSITDRELGVKLRRSVLSIQVHRAYLKKKQKNQQESQAEVK